MTQNVCSRCAKDDKFEKISAIVKYGRTSGKYSGPSGGVVYAEGEWGIVGGRPNLDGHSSSDLARLLSPPPKPRMPGNWLLALTSGFLVFAVAGAMMTGLLAYEADQNLASLSRSLLVWGVFIVFLSVTVVAVWTDKRTKNLKSRSALSSWKKALNVWDRLYYCFRDDLVVDPQTGTTYRPNELGQVLFKDSARYGTTRPPRGARRVRTVTVVLTLLVLFMLACPVIASGMMDVLDRAANGPAGGALAVDDMSSIQLTALAGTIEALSTDLAVDGAQSPEQVQTAVMATLAADFEGIGNTGGGPASTATPQPLPTSD